MELLGASGAAALGKGWGLPDEEFKGEEVGGSGRIPMREWRRPKGMMRQAPRI